MRQFCFSPKLSKNEFIETVRVPCCPTFHMQITFSGSVYSWTGPEREPENPAAPLPAKENEQQKRQKIINWPNDRQVREGVEYGK